MVDNVIDRAIGTYQKEKELWSELIENAVASDHSWGHSMHEYLSCYKNLRSITSKPVKKQKTKES